MTTRAARTIDLTVDHPKRSVSVDVLEALLLHVWDGEEGPPGTLSVVLTDHATVLDLNRLYLQHDYLTDVLAFSLSDAPNLFDGEIYIDLDTAAERHTEFDASFEHEVYRYAVHGLLHLLGYDDHTPDGKAAMHQLEDKYLADALRAGS